MTIPRTLVFDVSDIAVNHEEIAESLNHACRRTDGRCTVSGLCQVDNVVFFPLENSSIKKNVSYVFAPCSGMTKDHIEADIFTRWRSGFTTKGIIRLSESYMGLFELTPDNDGM